MRNDRSSCFPPAGEGVDEGLNDADRVPSAGLDAVWVGVCAFIVSVLSQGSDLRRIIQAELRP